MDDKNEVMPDIGTDNAESENEQQEEKNISSEPRFSGFWRRVFAFLLDNLILAVFGFILGLAFGNQFNHMGAYARTVGFVIVLIYFGIFNSSIGKGQTLGKRAMKIRTVGMDGEPVSFAKALLRALVLFIPNYAALLLLLIPLDSSILAAAVNVLAAWIGLAIVYLIIFNRRTMQSLHDLLMGTYVVKADNQKAPAAEKTSRVHYIIVAILLLVCIVSAGTLDNLLAQKFGVSMGELKKLENKISRETGAAAVTVNEGVNFSNGVKTSYIITELYYKGDTDGQNALAQKAARIVLDNYENAKEKDLLIVKINGGYDIGVFKLDLVNTASAPPQDWINSF